MSTAPIVTEQADSQPAATAMAASTGSVSDSGGLFASLVENPYFGAGFGLLGIGAALSLLRRGVMQAGTLAQRRLLTTLEIPARDKSYSWFLQWMSTQRHRVHVPHLSVQTLFKQHENGSVTTEFSFVPGPGKHFLCWQGALMQVG